MAGFWFPRFNADGSRLTHQDATINKYQAQFMGAIEIWHNGNNLVFNGAVQPIKSYNQLAAGVNRWAGYRPDTGVESNFRAALPLAGWPTISPEGTFFAYVDKLQSDLKTLILEFDNQTANLDFGSIYEVRLSERACVWMKNGRTQGHWFGKQAGDIQVAPREGQPVPIDLPDGSVWVGSLTDTGVIVRPFGEKFGYRFDNGGQTYYPDWIWDGQDIRCVFTDEHGNFGEKFFDLTAPRVDLSKPLVSDSIVKIGRRLWCGWYEFGGIPTSLPPANCLMFVPQNGLIRKLNSQFIYQWFDGLTVEEIEEQVQNSAFPAVVYWDARFWPRYPQLESTDIMLLQANCLVGEEPIFEINMQKVIDSVPSSYQNLGLSCQCYTSNTDQTSNLIALVPIFARLAKNNPRIKMLLVFSDQGRATGLNDHPEVRPYWKELFDGITGEPIVAERPRVTITLFEPKEGNAPLRVRAVAELSGGPAETLSWKLDGETVVVNPADDLDHTYTLNHPGKYNLGVRVDGPGGSDQTGNPRIVTVKEVIPPDPPVPPTNRKYLKINSLYLNVKDERIFLNDTPTPFEIGENFVRANGKYIANQPDGVLEVNRDSVGAWEEYTFNKVGESISIKSKEWNKYWGPVNGMIEGNFNSQLFFQLEDIKFDASVAIAGKFFTRLDGTPITIIQCSEFSLYKYYLDGQDVDSILSERQALGFNCLRVWLLNTSVIPGGLEPKNYPEFYAKLVPFTQLCASYGFIVEYTIFTQTKTLMPSLNAQQNHLNAVAISLQDETNVLLELVNENDQHDNECSNKLQQPMFHISSHGSNGADNHGVEPVWNYSQYHTNDLNEWQRKVGHNAMELANTYGVPVVSNENMRCPDRDSNSIHFFDAAAGATLLCAGACFHSQGGKFSRLFDDVERFCASEWVKGANSVPVKFQNGQYIRRDDLLEPGVIRVYEKRIGGESYILKIRA